MVCLLCEHRPAKAGCGFCANCQQKVDSLRNGANHEQAFKFVTYQGHVVGFYRSGGDKLIPRLLQRNPEHLPRCRTIDLNTYVDGFTREQVKKLKACIKSLTSLC